MFPFKDNRQGYYENQQEILTHRGRIESKAPEHYNASEKGEAAPNTQITPPLQQVKEPKPEAQKDIKLAWGWEKTSDGYSFTKKCYENHSSFDITTGILHASIMSNHGRAELIEYWKDTVRLTELQEVEETMEARLSSYTTSDPAYAQIAKRLFDVKNEIRHITNSLRPVKNSRVVLNDGFTGDMNSGEYNKWASDFMNKTVQEYNKLAKNTTPDAEGEVK